MPFRPGATLLCTALLGLFAICVHSQEVSDPILNQKLKAAEEKQENREDSPFPVMAKLIKEGPAAFLPSGTGDVSTTGNCAGDIDNFCPTVDAGVSRLATCLSNQQEEEAKGNVLGKKLTEACKAELAEFKIALGANVNANIPLAEACKGDAAKLCKDEDPTDPGAVLPCLREQKDKLSRKCSEEVFKTQVEGSRDYRTDADLHAACERDAKSLCSDIKPGEGRVQACLRQKPFRLSWECQEELFRQEVENADNIILSYVLLRKCMADKKRFCNDVLPGNARVKDCLEEHRNDAGFSSECKEEFEKMMEGRAQDFRLDSALRDACSDDIDYVCGFEKESLDNVQGFDASVVTCLQDYVEDLSSERCRAEVHNVKKRAAQDIRFDAPLAEACYEDREKFCSGILPGSARVVRCLQDNRGELSSDCTASLFNQEVRMAEDIDFKYPMNVACNGEIKKFCADYEHGDARVVRCLQEHRDELEMSQECKDEVERDELHSSQDYRLNYRLARACEEDQRSLCRDACPEAEAGQPCGGRVLRCLTENQDQIFSMECRMEVFYFGKMEVIDFRNDVILAEACRQDVDRFCYNIWKGEGRVLACLRSHRADLQEQCRDEEDKLTALTEEMAKAKDDRRIDIVAEACKADKNRLCANACSEGRSAASCQWQLRRCLTNVQSQIRSAQCKAVILYMEKVALMDFRIRNDIH